MKMWFALFLYIGGFIQIVFGAALIFASFVTIGMRTTPGMGVFGVLLGVLLIYVANRLRQDDMILNSVMNGAVANVSRRAANSWVTKLICVGLVAYFFYLQFR